MLSPGSSQISLVRKKSREFKDIPSSSGTSMVQISRYNSKYHLAYISLDIPMDSIDTSNISRTHISLAQALESGGRTILSVFIC